MNEFLIAVENHPWTVFWLWVGTTVIAHALSPNITINKKD